MLVSSQKPNSYMGGMGRDPRLPAAHPPALPEPHFLMKL